jgi:voltage-gated potassium channel
VREFLTFRRVLCPSTIAARTPMRALRNVKFLSAALLCVAIIGTAGFHFIEHWSWFDGFYMVLTTLTTIGYQEVHPLSQAGRYFNVGIILAGVGLVFLILGALGQALLEFEFNNLLGRRKMEREIARLKEHYIICGAGRVGRAVARQLANKPAPFIILESDEAKADRLRSETNWLVVHADATLEAQLLAARIEHAAGLVATTTTDATNTYVVLTARGLNSTLKIIARASEEGAEKHMKTAGADQVISPYSFAGFRIAQAFLRPHVINFLEVALVRSSELGLELEELTIDSSSVYVGQALRSSRIRHDLGITVLAIKRAGEEMKYSPAADALLCAGDHLIVMGEPSKLRELEVLAGARR